MRERDSLAASYRDLLLESGVLVMLSPDETAALCQGARRLRRDSVIGTALDLGLLLVDDGRGALLALPPDLDVIRGALKTIRRSGLVALERRVRNSAGRSGLSVGRIS